MNLENIANKKQNWRLYGIRYWIKWFLGQVNRRTVKLKKDSKHTHGGHYLISENEFDRKIREELTENKPFMIARYGSTEATIMYQALGVECGAIKEVKDKYFNNLMNLSGFFPNNKNLIARWLELMKSASSSVDILCYWETGYQEYLVDKCCKDDVVLTDLDCLQPFWSEHPWTASLKGKKVLVIHPFAETIISQYNKREYIWKNPDILPDFTLYTVKAVQTLAGTQDDRFETWFDALDWMFNEGMKYDFDVAIVACGAYGMPLAAKFKKAGKQAIHWGGMSQIWFGIKGGRWDNNPRVNQFYNESWVRPGENEKISGQNKVEGACYW